MSRFIALVLGALTMAGVALLLAWDVKPDSFPASAHLVLGAIPLALIALSYSIYQIHMCPPRAHVLRAIILAVAFLCWAENQLLGDGRFATLFNDLAIALFVVDVFLTMVGWPLEQDGSPGLL